MTNAPYLLPKARAGLRMGHGQVLDHMFYDGLEDAHDKGRPISRRPGIPGSPGAAAGPIRFLDRPFESRRRGVVRGWEPIQTEWRPLADDWPARSP